VAINTAAPPNAPRTSGCHRLVTGESIAFRSLKLKRATNNAAACMKCLLNRVTNFDFFAPLKEEKVAVGFQIFHHDPNCTSRNKLLNCQ
jgi:hypothetical protein